MKFISKLVVLCILILLHCTARAQTTPQSVKPILARRIQATAVTAFQVQQFLAERAPKLPTPRTAQEWTATESQLRAYLLNNIVFHGWPSQWVDSPPRFEETGVIETSHGYRLRKLRYEIVPGFWSTAILYDPEHIHSKAPAILNVYGHLRLGGKAAEYVQKRCINFAKRGIVTLCLEWIGFGELSDPYNWHNDYGPHLNLVGANVLGLFYLAMRRGLDYLADLPQVDAKRIGMTGLSGGGWQTIVLSSLDPRIAVAVEVAGMGGYRSNIIQPRDTDEPEQNAPDFNERLDYSELVAMRAPRPTLLIHDADDNCCFRSMLVKPEIYEAIKPFFQLFNKPGALAWHENLDPGTHNYQLDNRQQAYQFFTRYFNLPITGKEIPSDTEVMSYDDLKVGLSPNNLTMLGLARQFAAQIKRLPVPTDTAGRARWAHRERERLKSVVRYTPVKIQNVWRVWNTKTSEVESLSYRFDLTNGLSSAGVWLKATTIPSTAPATIILADNGRESASDLISDSVNRGGQVLALDVILNGEMLPEEAGSSDYDYLLDMIGVRPIGLEAAQLIAASQWLSKISGNKSIRLETIGIRSQVVAITAAAIDPNLFSQLRTYGGMRSLDYLLSAPVPYRKAPDLFCLDFYKDFDIKNLAALAKPVKIIQFQLMRSTSKGPCPTGEK